MQITLFDDPAARKALAPFTDTRPIAEIRVGITTIIEKWKNTLGLEAGYLTEDFLQKKFPLKQKEDNILINATVLPNQALVEAIRALEPGQALLKDKVVAVRYKGAFSNEELYSKQLTRYNPIPFTGDVVNINNLYDIFLKNGAEITREIRELQKQRKSAEISDPHVATYNSKDIFIEEGAELRSCVLNATKGPIYIGKGAEVMEGAVIQGPFALCEGARVNMSAQMWGDTTIGPFCKVGGEISNAVFFAYSNKAHAGYVGNSVIGEWCNLGADTNTSNLKNNYKTVRLWHYGYNELQDTGLQFCGLMLGDHAKSSINTMFNTGSVVGTCANIFGIGFPDKFTPAFTWGDSRTTYQLEKAIETAERVLARKHKVLSQEDRAIFKHIFETSEKYRRHR